MYYFGMKYGLKFNLKKYQTDITSMNTSAVMLAYPFISYSEVSCLIIPNKAYLP